MNDTIALGVITAGTIVTKEMLQRMAENHRARAEPLVRLPVVTCDRVGLAQTKAARVAGLNSN